MLNKRDYSSIDIVKIVMALFVIAIHTHPFEEVTNPVFLSVYNGVVGLAVPFFFVSTGYFSYSEIDLTTRVEKTFKKVSRLYLVWVVIYLPLTIYGLVSNDDGILIDALRLFQGLLFSGENFNSWPLWYLLASIYSLFVIRRLLGNQWSVKCIFLIALALYALHNLLIYIPIYATINSLLCVDRFCMGLLYISIGLMIRFYDHTIIRRWVLVALGLSAFSIDLWMTGYTSCFLKPLYVACLFIIIKNMNLNCGIGPTLRTTSTIFYFTHMIVFSIHGFIIYGNPSTYGTIPFLVTVIFCVLLSVIIIKLQQTKLSKGIKFLFF